MRFAELLCLANSLTSDRLCRKELKRISAPFFFLNLASLQDLFGSICCCVHRVALLPVSRTRVQECGVRTLRAREGTKLISGEGGLCCTECDVVISVSN